MKSGLSSSFDRSEHQGFRSHASVGSSPYLDQRILEGLHSRVPDHLHPRGQSSLFASWSTGGCACDEAGHSAGAMTNFPARRFVSRRAGLPIHTQSGLQSCRCACPFPCSCAHGTEGWPSSQIRGAWEGRSAGTAPSERAYLPAHTKTGR